MKAVEQPREESETKEGGTEKIPRTGTGNETSIAATGGRMPVIASKRTSKLTRASYPIFYRHVATQGQLSSINKGNSMEKTNNSSIMTPAPAVHGVMGVQEASHGESGQSTSQGVNMISRTKPSSRGKIPTVEGNKSPGNMENNSTAMATGPTPNYLNNSSTMAPALAPRPVPQGMIGLAQGKDVQGKGATKPNSNNSTSSPPLPILPQTI